MPSKVRFQTEYESTFNNENDIPVRANRSPILKPRFKPEMHSKSENSTKSSQVKEAGIASTSSHQIEEPPLQHRRIVSYDRNHNIIKTNTTEWCNTISEKNEERNPILEYDAVVQNSRKQDEKSTKKMADERSGKKAEISNRIAGKSSDNLRYLALEPPMQRRRVSPYKLNHNILKTTTVDYLNGNGNSDTSSQLSDLKTGDEKDMKDVKRKLEFENGKKANEGKNFNKTQDIREKQSKPSPPTPKDLQNATYIEPKVMFDQNAVNAESKTIPESSHTGQKHKMSPTKLQRKKDLEDLKNKQNERVDRALRIKAGLQTIEPPLHSHHVKSEYQRQFAWKQPIIVNKPTAIPSYPESKNSQINGPVAKKKPKQQKTEYQRQFKQYPLVNIYNQEKEANVEAQKLDENEKEKLSDDKSAKDRPRDLPDKRLIRSSRNEQPLFFPHPGYENAKTEYESNYQPPMAFHVQNGAWQDATPPQLYPNKMKPDDIKALGDWFKEVLRLREKAEQYKMRARDTHYPTTFYASLQDDVSDISNNSSRKNSASSEQDQHALIPVRNFDKSTETEPEQAVSSDKDDQNGADPVDEGVQQQHGDEIMGGKPSADDGWNDDDNRPNSSSSASTDSNNDLFKGRINTARLASTNEHRRHNLDRTTPLRSGTIAEPGKRISSDITAPFHSFRSSDLKSSEKRIVFEKERPRRKQHGGYGGFHETSQIKRTSSVPKAYHHSNYEDKENKNDLIVSDIDTNHDSFDIDDLNVNKIIKPPRAFVQPSEIGHKYSLEINNSNIDDIDMLSETSLSARDSVISDVLERSKLRRDNFW